MIKKVFRIIFTILGLLVGYIFADSIVKSKYIAENGYFSNIILLVSFYIILTVIFGIILFILSPAIYRAIRKFMSFVERSISKLSPSEIIFGVLGAIIALIIASIFTIPLNSIFNKMDNKFSDFIGPLILIVGNLISIAIGVDLAVKKREDILGYLENLKRDKSTQKEKKSKVKGVLMPKVLDTSVIIDGRIFDLCQTGFIEGPLVIPSFVLDELRHISDCSDSLKRTRGRRGLDILNKIQKELTIEVQIWEGDFPEISEVDSKLLKLGQKLSGKVITNDYNLNKVAEVQGVPVLNINELANAIKPVVLPGEDMKLTVVKDGKESGQGVAYLDDGTMIVVEGGRKFIGEEINVVVTSVLQTAAGRMIFAKQKA